MGGKSKQEYVCAICGKIHKNYSHIWRRTINGVSKHVCTKCKIANNLKEGEDNIIDTVIE